MQFHWTISSNARHYTESQEYCISTRYGFCPSEVWCTKHIHQNHRDTCDYRLRYVMIKMTQLCKNSKGTWFMLRPVMCAWLSWYLNDSKRLWSLTVCYTLSQILCMSFCLTLTVALWAKKCYFCFVKKGNLSTKSICSRSHCESSDAGSMIENENHLSIWYFINLPPTISVIYLNPLFFPFLCCLLFNCRNISSPGIFFTKYFSTGLEG